MVGGSWAHGEGWVGVQPTVAQAGCRHCQGHGACLDLKGTGVLRQHNLTRRLHCRNFGRRVAAVEAGAGGGAEAACSGGRVEGTGRDEGGRAARNVFEQGMLRGMPATPHKVRRGRALGGTSPAAKHSQYILRHMLRLQLQGRCSRSCMPGSRAAGAAD